MAKTKQQFNREYYLRYQSRILESRKANRAEHGQIAISFLYGRKKKGLLATMVLSKQNSLSGRQEVVFKNAKRHTEPT
jgi:hypothetical protein